MKFDPTLPVRTRDGREVKIYSTEGGGTHPIHGATHEEGFGLMVGCWTADGKWSSPVDTRHDLVNVPRRIKVERWLNVYQDGAITDYTAKRDADINAMDSRVACKFITFEVEEGEGL